MRKETKLIKDFLKEINFQNIKVRSVKNETQCDMENQIIYFNMKDFQDDEFNKIVKTYYNKIGHKNIKIHMATYAIFHELGHIASMVEIKNFDKTFNAYINGQNRLPKRVNAKTKFYKYRNLRLEKLADKYAYIIYKEFEKQAIKFDKKLSAMVKSA
jgi:hypothetical protein